ncbi:MAG: hypothetical protein DMG34_21660 [Acidobacteria bacterium]|nr:MAG: hypothetical protein DMG34_21660 [Acidobacteriota bacterium]
MQGPISIQVLATPMSGLEKSSSYVSPDTGQALKESPNQFAARNTVPQKNSGHHLGLDDGPNFSELRC